ncbi:truC [Symbiodinium necroappetens]|uniref:TruC protein n=1 Tax=Symbiodinium necroappetens TaxID=1628268 RepID=A0A813AYI8_9DINO|nr:truC [Symbiodinium necroappetens]
MPEPDYKTRHEFTGSGLEPRELEALVATLPLLLEEEDEGLVAVAKPSGISSEKALEAMAASLSKPLFAVSRLDLPTSGVLPAALGTEQSPEARWHLAQFAAHSLVEKTYLCLCQGTEGSLGEVGAEGRVELPLKVVATSRSTSRAVPSAEGKRARTDFQVLAVFAEATSQLSLIEARPRTGRLHQIRAHLAALGAPLVGDHLYGAQRVSWCRRLFLHCQRLKLFGPSREVRLEAPLPAELREALLGLRLLRGRFPS